MKKLILCTAIIVFYFLESSGQDTLRIPSFLPNHIKVQFAGNIGFVSLGIGYSLFHSSLQTSFFYSYVPDEIGGANINIASFKCSYSFLNLRMKPQYKISTYLGSSLSYAGFTPIQVLPHLGTGFSIKPHHSFIGEDIFFEVGTTGLYLNYIASNREVGIASILNYSMGITLFYDRTKQ